MSEIQLVVQADDLGMCHSVNEAIQRSFEEGIVRQTVAMAPCPWVDEGLAFAKSSGIFLGMHCTLTSEWEYLRWRPFTDGTSLSGGDGSFHRTLRAAMDEIDASEASAELEAQYEHLIGLGVEPAFFDCHMGPASSPAFAHMVEKYDRPFLYPLASPCYRFASVQMLSERPAAEKLAWLIAYIDALVPGTHFLCTHPGVAGTELASLTPRDAENAPWTDEYRVSDLEVLTSAAVRDRLEARGVALVTVAEIEAVAKAT